MQQGFLGTNSSFPSTMQVIPPFLFPNLGGSDKMATTRPNSYRYDVHPDGTLNNRVTFAFVTPGSPGGIHVDVNGNVFVGCGDGVLVFNSSGRLIGKIYVGGVSANFQFAGQGRIVILVDTELYFVTLAAEGAFPGKLYH